MPGYSFIGKPLPRVDGMEKATGKTVFGLDFSLPGMLCGKLLRSPYPHARIISIDTGRAKKIDGVIAVITSADVPADSLMGASLDRPLFARDKVHFIGEPVAAVAAVDEEIAERSLEAIRIGYEELPGVYDTEKALLPGAPLVHENIPPPPAYDKSGGQALPPALTQRESLNSMIKRFPGTNIAMCLSLDKGDILRGFAESDFVFEDTFRGAQLYQAYLEPHAAVAQVDSEDNVTVWTNSSRAFPIASDIIRIFNLPKERVRVIVTAIGGSFGGKNWLALEPYCVALSRKAGKPVKMALTCEEEMSTASGSVPAIIKMKTGVKKDGTLVAKEIEFLWDTGAYGDGLTTLTVSRNTALGPYRIPHVRVDTILVYTNNMPTNPFRSFGAQYVAWANERQMDIIAQSLKIDPLEIRKKNILVNGDTTTSGDLITSAHLDECLERAARAIGWGRDPGKNRGLGIACFIKGSPISTLSEVTVNVNGDGTVEVFSGNGEVGQGLKTLLAQVVGEELALNPENIRVFNGDSSATPYDDGAYGSRSTVCTGNAAMRAAQDVREQLLKIAGHILERPESDLSISDGKIFSKSAEGGLPFAQIAKYGKEGRLTAKGSSRSSAPGGKQAPISESHFGAEAAEVEVDSESGIVRVIRAVTAHDTGQVINTLCLEGQMDGGVIMGIGAALMEEKIFDRGKLLNPNLSDYKIFTSRDVPEIVKILVEGKDGFGPFNATGTGEETNIGIIAAVGNAIHKATGVNIKDIPIRPYILIKSVPVG